MNNGINNHLKRISSELFIKHGSTERVKINNSVSSIIKKLDDYFVDTIDDAIMFGSYERDTILPRKYDPCSDIDILVVFNTQKYAKLKVESYRNLLKKFAQTFYTNSMIVKDYPSIVIELNHIKFDLVPAIIDEGFFYDSIEIPGKESRWMETEPAEYSERLIAKNKKFNFIVKPIIRLMKYWNASQMYPYNSFELEEQIVGMNLKNDNLESGLLYVIDNLSSHGFSSFVKEKVRILKKSAELVEMHLNKGEIAKAKAVLQRVLPGGFT